MGFLATHTAPAANVTALTSCRHHVTIRLIEDAYSSSCLQIKTCGGIGFTEDVCLSSPGLITRIRRGKTSLGRLPSAALTPVFGRGVAARGDFFTVNASASTSVFTFRLTPDTIAADKASCVVPLLRESLLADCSHRVLSCSYIDTCPLLHSVRRTIKASIHFQRKIICKARVFSPPLNHIPSGKTASSECPIPRRLFVRSNTSNAASYDTLPVALRSRQPP